MLDEVFIACPYCGEDQAVEVEPQAIGHRYVDDCRVCCQPMVLEIGHGPDGAPTVDARRDDD